MSNTDTARLAAGTRVAAATWTQWDLRGTIFYDRHNLPVVDGDDHRHYAYTTGFFVPICTTCGVDISDGPSDTHCSADLQGADR